MEIYRSELYDNNILTIEFTDGVKIIRDISGVWYYWDESNLRYDILDKDCEHYRMGNKFFNENNELKL